MLGRCLCTPSRLLVPTFTFCILPFYIWVLLGSSCSFMQASQHFCLTPYCSYPPSSPCASPIPPSTPNPICRLWLNTAWLEHKYVLCCCPWYHRQDWETWLAGKGCLELQLELMDHTEPPVPWDCFVFHGWGELSWTKEVSIQLKKKKGQIPMGLGWKLCMETNCKYKLHIISNLSHATAFIPGQTPKCSVALENNFSHIRRHLWSFSR